MQIENKGAATCGISGVTLDSDDGVGGWLIASPYMGMVIVTTSDAALSEPKEEEGEGAGAVMVLTLDEFKTLAETMLKLVEKLKKVGSGDDAQI